MLKRIITELREHAPFTAFGALTGILILILFHNMSSGISYDLFYIFHPLHVLFSALTTAAMYHRYKQKRTNLFLLLFIGYVGSVGIATLSDSIVPYLGETLLNMPHRHAHIGFIEKWWLVNPLAILGIAFAYLKPLTKLPHFTHVLLSTWASLFHIMMAMGESLNLFIYIIVFAFLFLAVWLPCCISDIVFPLLFVRGRDDPELKAHSHVH